MFDWIGDSIEAFWRSISWDAMSFIINLVKSYVKDIIIPFANLSFMDNEFVKTGFDAFQKIAIPLLSFAVIMQILIHSVKGDLNDKLKKVMIGAILSSLVIAGVQPVVSFLNTKSIELAQTLSTDDDLASLDDSLTVAFIQGANAGIDTDEAKAFVEDIKKPDFDYNATVKEGENKGEYKYTLNLFSTLAIGLIMLFMLTYVAFQILLRGISLAFLLLFAPFASVTLVMEDTGGWRYTQNQIMHNLIMNVFQLYILLFSIKFMSVTDDINAFGKVLIIIVALLFVIQTPQMIAGMFGGQSSSLMSTAQSALMGANAGRALTMGAVGAGLATLGSLGNGIKGVFSGGGKGMLGLAGNSVNAGARFAKSSVTGNTNTIFGRKGNKANEWGSAFHNKVKSGFGGKGGGSTSSTEGTPQGNSNQDETHHGSAQSNQENVASSPINDNVNSYETGSSSGETFYQGANENVASSSINENTNTSETGSSNESSYQGGSENVTSSSINDTVSTHGTRSSTGSEYGANGGVRLSSSSMQKVRKSQGVSQSDASSGSGSSNTQNTRPIRSGQAQAQAQANTHIDKRTHTQANSNQEQTRQRSSRKPSIRKIRPNQNNDESQD